MSREIAFGAPWGSSLKLMTGLAVLILLGVTAIGLAIDPGGGLIWTFAMVTTPLAVLAISVFFVIRGYVLTGDELRIRRLGWSSRLALSNLVSATADPEAMKRSIRIFGNGGLFCFAGLFYNKKLGRYRAFATDPARSVVLHFTDRLVVVTPEEPRDFVSRLGEPRR